VKAFETEINGTTYTKEEVHGANLFQSDLVLVL
jgi:hypothetical protein